MNVLEKSLFKNHNFEFIILNFEKNIFIYSNILLHNIILYIIYNNI